MKKTLLAILAVLAVTAVQAQDNLSAAVFFAGLPPSDRNTLVQTGELSSSGSQVLDLKYGPATPWSPTLRDAWAGRQTTLAAEGIFLFNLPKAKDPEARLLALYNALNAVSTMEGLTYFSASRQQTETLILSSYRVEGQDKKDRLPDLTSPALPSSSRLVVFQKDNKFGDGWSEILFRRQGGTLVLTIRNLSSLNFGFFPLVNAGDLQTTFYLTPLQDKIAVYAALGVKTGSFFGMEKSKEESFLNRMKALSSWLKSRIQSLS